jgi:hypothetical protein
LEGVNILTHIVLYRLEDNSAASIEKVREVFMGMQGKIEQLKHIEVGIDVMHSERSYDLCLVTKFDSLEDLKAYKAHPLHIEVSKFIHSVWKSSASVDFEA